jgi:hypothetical protein
MLAPGEKGTKIRDKVEIEKPETVRYVALPLCLGWQGTYKAMENMAHHGDPACRFAAPLLSEEVKGMALGGIFAK